MKEKTCFQEWSFGPRYKLLEGGGDAELADTAAAYLQNLQHCYNNNLHPWQELFSFNRKHYRTFSHGNNIKVNIAVLVEILGFL